jgi:hypothetical protein
MNDEQPSERLAAFIIHYSGAIVQGMGGEWLRGVRFFLLDGFVVEA